MSTFLELSIIIAIAATISALMRLLRQPALMGYLITGLLVGPYVFNLLKSQETLQLFSQLGIAMLLFIVGLNLSPRVIREIGKTALITGLGQIFLTTAAGFIIIHFLFGWSILPSLCVSLALTFSSTIIVMKILSDKQDLQKLYAKISIGILIIQDVIAAILLIFFSAFKSGGSWNELVIVGLLKAVIIAVVLVIISLYLLPRLTSFFAHSQEMLFLFSIAWGLGLASLFYLLGFSLEIGALTAGVALSMSPYQLEISAKMKPLRDFFIILFFIMLGSQMAVANLNQLIVPGIFLSLFVLIIDPLIVIVLLGALGYHRKTSFLAGLTIAQISEFSLILMMAATQTGRVPKELLSLVTFIGLITMGVSSYLILHAESLYPRLASILGWFERTKVKPELLDAKKCDVILFGCDRIGFDIINTLRQLKKKYLVIDFNPDIIEKLRNDNVNCIYGDAEDNELLEQLDLEKTTMIISTIADVQIDLFLLKKIKAANSAAILIVVSHNIAEALKLYSAGASYVILPHFLGGQYAAMMIKHLKMSAEKFENKKRDHLKYLASRKKSGHEHPRREIKH